MKCIVCIFKALNQKDVSTVHPVQEGVWDARDAVTVVGGRALCVTHLHEGYIVGTLTDVLR